MTDKEILPEVFRDMAKTMMAPYNLGTEGEEALMCICDMLYKHGYISGETRGLERGNENTMQVIESQANRLGELCREMHDPMLDHPERTPS